MHLGIRFQNLFVKSGLLPIGAEHFACPYFGMACEMNKPNFNSFKLPIYQIYMKRNYHQYNAQVILLTAFNPDCKYFTSAKNRTESNN
jgi:hypothetical protein